MKKVIFIAFGFATTLSIAQSPTGLFVLDESCVVGEYQRAKIPRNQHSLGQSPCFVLVPPFFLVHELFSRLEEERKLRERLFEDFERRARERERDLCQRVAANPELQCASFR